MSNAQLNVAQHYLVFSKKPLEAFLACFAALFSFADINGFFFVSLRFFCSLLIANSMYFVVVHQANHVSHTRETRSMMS